MPSFTCRKKLRRLLAVTCLVTLAPTPFVASAKTFRGSPRPGAECVRANSLFTATKFVLRCEAVARGKRIWRVNTMRSNASERIIEPATGESKAITVVTQELNPPSELAETNPAVTATIVTTVEPEPERKYEVLPDPENGGSPEVVSVTPESTELADSTLPQRVPSFQLVSIDETSAQFRLTPLAGISNYLVYLRHGDSYTLKGIDVDSPTVVFNDLNPDWAYTACAYYRQNEVESEKSCLAVHTLGTRPTPAVTPAGPDWVAATATDRSITVNWSQVPGASWYSICHVRGDSHQCGGYTMLTPTSAIFQDGSIFPGWEYLVKIQAVYSDGSRTQETVTSIKSLGSQPVPTSRLAGVSNFRVTSVTPTTATIVWTYEDSSLLDSWTVIARHLTSYSSTGADPSAREFTVINLVPGNGYEITIQGRSNNNETEIVSTSVLIPNL